MFTIFNKQIQSALFALIIITMQSSACIRDSMPHPLWKKHSVYSFRPDSGSCFPTIFFFHGITAENPASYGGLIDHMVRSGYQVLYTPYSTIIAMTRPWETYDVLNCSLDSATTRWRKYIDTTRVGFVGHSYGGGAAPFFAWQYLHARKWGNAQAFVYTMAPWFSWNLSNENLNTFPSNVHFIAEVFNDDNINDHRMAIDLYSHIAIPASHKRFVFVCGEQGKLRASHDLPNGDIPPCAGTNHSDSVAVYDIFDRLSNASFLQTGFDTDSILGGMDADHKTRFIDHAPLHIEVQSAPIPSRGQGFYMNFYNHLMNPRAHSETASGRPSATNTILNFYNVLSQKMLNDNSEMRMHAKDQDISGRWLWNPEIGDRKMCLLINENSKGLHPVMFFLPSLLQKNFESYYPFLVAAARTGWAVIYSEQDILGSGESESRRARMVRALCLGVEPIRSIIDTSRMAIVGQGTGASQIPGTINTFLHDRGWGKTRFYCMAVSSAKVTDSLQLTAQESRSLRIIGVVGEDGWVQDWHFTDALAAMVAKSGGSAAMYTLHNNDTTVNMLSPRTMYHGQTEFLLFQTSATWLLFSQGIIDNKEIDLPEISSTAVPGISETLQERKSSQYFFGSHFQRFQSPR